MSARVVTFVSLLALAGCHKETCEDFTPEPNAGQYLGGGSLGEDQLLDVSLTASAKQVVLSYKARDGSRIKAIYRVAKKAKR